jgi:hypothetical protein
MEKRQFQSWEVMLHILPGLKQICDALFEDVQNKMPAEILRRRFRTLTENIIDMAEAARTLKHTPQFMEPIVEVLQTLAKTSAAVYQESKTSDYEALVRGICQILLFVVSFEKSVSDVSTFLSLPRGRNQKRI